MVCRRKTGCARIVSGDFPQKKELRKQFLLSGLYEFLPAFGTGDRDLSLAFGYSHLLVAPWAIIITVILVFYLLEKEEKLSVFLIALINISLAVFNLIPIPPLDGSKILAALLPNRIYWQLMRYERYFGIIIFVLIFASSRFSNLLSGIVTSIYGAFSNFSGLIFNIF